MAEWKYTTEWAVEWEPQDKIYSNSARRCLQPKAGSNRKGCILQWGKLAGQERELRPKPRWEFKFHRGRLRMNQFIFPGPKSQKARKSMPWFIPGHVKVWVNKTNFRDHLLMGLRLYLHGHPRFGRADRLKLTWVLELDRLGSNPSSVTS